MVLPPLIKPCHLAIWFSKKYPHVIWNWEVRRREGCYLIKAPSHGDPIILSEERSHLRIRYKEADVSIPQTDKERILAYFEWVAKKFVSEGNRHAEKTS